MQWHDANELRGIESAYMHALPLALRPFGLVSNIIIQHSMHTVYVVVRRYDI